MLLDGKLAGRCSGAMQDCSHAQLTGTAAWRPLPMQMLATVYDVEYKNVAEGLEPMVV